MNTERKPDAVVTFDHRIRAELVFVEASAWLDDSGIYQTRIDGVFLDGVNVAGLLTSYDLADIDMQIEPAVLQDRADDAATAFDPARDAFTFGE